MVVVSSFGLMPELTLIYRRVPSTVRGRSVQQRDDEALLRREHADVQAVRVRWMRRE